MATKRQLLIDADFTLYQLCCAIQSNCGFPALNPETLEPYDETEKVEVLWADPSEVHKAMKDKVAWYLEELKADEAILVFSGRSNFRKEVWPAYKSDRSTGKPPAYWTTIRLLKAEGLHQIVLEECLEGDDYIGILATRPSPVERIAVMTDKDVLTLPGIKVYRNDEIQVTTAESAERYHMLQTLTGDTTDGYKGCPGLGPVGAKAVLDKPGDLWVNVLKAYEDAWTKEQKAFAKALAEGKTPASKFVTGSPLEEALLNARMARILRFEDWDPKARRPILWHPEPSERRTYASPAA